MYGWRLWQLSQDDTTRESGRCHLGTRRRLRPQLHTHFHHWQQPRCGRGNVIESREIRVGGPRWGRRWRHRESKETRSRRETESVSERERERERGTRANSASTAGTCYTARRERERLKEGRPTDRLIPIRQATRSAISGPYLLSQVLIAGGAALATDRSTTLYLSNTDICKGGASYRVTDA